MRQKLINMMVVAVLSFAVASPAKAETNWVEFKVGRDTVRALIALPSGTGPHPAVLYNHGSIVRIKGYDEARSRGYDTDGYVQALADAGYVGLAPIRDHLALLDYQQAIIGGEHIVNAAIAYLKARNDVDPARIGAIGFSEGGLVSLWSALEGADVKALVLMSPATIRDAKEKRLKAAAKRSVLKRLKMPVMLTVGAHDNKSIRKISKRMLVPNFKRLDIPFTYKTDYPGDHRWFWSVRPEHFSAVTAFLDEHMK